MCIAGYCLKYSFKFEHDHLQRYAWDALNKIQKHFIYTLLALYCKNPDVVNHRPGAIPTPIPESESESFVVSFGGVEIGVGIVVIGIGVGIVMIGIGVGIGIV